MLLLPLFNTRRGHTHTTGRAQDPAGRGARLPLRVLGACGAAHRASASAGAGGVGGHQAALSRRAAGGGASLAAQARCHQQCQQRSHGIAEEGCRRVASCAAGLTPRSQYSSLSANAPLFPLSLSLVSKFLSMLYLDVSCPHLTHLSLILPALICILKFKKGN